MSLTLTPSPLGYVTSCVIRSGQRSLPEQRCQNAVHYKKRAAPVGVKNIALVLKAGRRGPISQFRWGRPEHSHIGTWHGGGM